MAIAKYLVFIFANLIGFMLAFHLGFAGLIASLFFFAPTLIFIWLTHRREQAFWQAVGCGFDPRLAWFAGLPGGIFSSGSGLCLKPKEKKIVLAYAGHCKTYSFEQIRGWKTAKQDAGGVVGGGLQGAALNLSMAGKAMDRSGLFIEVRDVDHPVWRMEMNEKHQARWFEVLQQVVNEGATTL